MDEVAEATMPEGEERAGPAEETPAPLPPHWRPGKSGPRPGVECCEETIETVCEIIRKGGFIHWAASALFATPKMLYHWMEDGKKGIPPFDEFYRRVCDARIEAEKFYVAIIDKAANEGDVKAAAQRLGWLNPMLYGQGVTHRGDPNNPVVVAPTVIKVPAFGPQEEPADNISAEVTSEEAQQHGLPADCGDGD